MGDEADKRVFGFNGLKAYGSLGDSRVRRRRRHFYFTLGVVDWSRISILTAPFASIRHVAANSFHVR